MPKENILILFKNLFIRKELKTTKTKLSQDDKARLIKSISIPEREHIKELKCYLQDELNDCKFIKKECCNILPSTTLCLLQLLTIYSSGLGKSTHPLNSSVILR